MSRLNISVCIEKAALMCYNIIVALALFLAERKEYKVNG